MEKGFTLLQRHNRLNQKYYRAFIKLNKNKLGKDNELKKHHTYIIPDLSEKTRMPMKLLLKMSLAEKIRVGESPFGKKEERVKLLNNQLEGACFYIVSGHGGPDPGAIGKMGNISFMKMSMHMI